MHLTLGDYLLWGASTVLGLGVCAAAFRRRLLPRLPLFTSYLVLVVAHNLSVWGAYLIWGYASRFAFYWFWLTQAAVLAARAMAIAELGWRVLREYRGVWALAWRLLCAIALLLLLHAAFNARDNAFRIDAFLLTAERGLELAVVGILVLLLAICRYYQIRLEAVHRMIALGLGFYSAVQVLNDSFSRIWLTQYFELGNRIRMVSFGVALVIWLLALLRPLPDAAPAPALLPQSVYDELSPQVNYRLRVLNQRLLEILKS